jgi:hypothetical protein
MLFLGLIKFVTEDRFTNIQTVQLNWKLFTKVIKRPSEGSLGLDRQCLNQKRSASAFNLMRDRLSKE